MKVLKRGVHQLADAVLKIAKASFCTPFNSLDVAGTVHPDAPVRGPGASVWTEARPTILFYK